MAGILPNEGETLVGNLLLKNTDVDRGTGLLLGLFTNSTISETTAYTDLVQPSGGNYVLISLTDANWALVGNDTFTYAKQTFNVTGTDYDLPIYGYFIATNGTTKRLIALEVDANGPFNMLVNDAYDVTPTIVVA